MTDTEAKALALVNADYMMWTSENTTTLLNGFKAMHTRIEVTEARHAAMTVQAEPVAWRYERTDGFVILVSKRYTDQHPKGDGWSEQALGVITTPPNGGSDGAEN